MKTRIIAVGCAIAGAVLLVAAAPACKDSRQAGKESREVFEKAKEATKEGLEKAGEVAKEGLEKGGEVAKEGLEKTKEAAGEFKKGWDEGGKQ